MTNNNQEGRRQSINSRAALPNEGIGRPHISHMEAYCCNRRAHLRDGKLKGPRGVISHDSYIEALLEPGLWASEACTRAPKWVAALSHGHELPPSRGRCETKESPNPVLGSPIFGGH